ncbi:MAG: hypothetical protein LBN22_10615 [Clostridiales Family XIII bacterium]|jgi:hypothetical protein|nr:hypothetical protein [Clostridiales Family XIII bacterium]
MNYQQVYPQAVDKNDSLFAHDTCQQGNENLFTGDLPVDIQFFIHMANNNEKYQKE